MNEDGAFEWEPVGAEGDEGIQVSCIRSLETFYSCPTAMSSAPMMASLYPRRGSRTLTGSFPPLELSNRHDFADTRRLDSPCPKPLPYSAPNSPQPANMSSNPSASPSINSPHIPSPTSASCALAPRVSTALSTPPVRNHHPHDLLEHPSPPQRRQGLYTGRALRRLQVR